MNYKEIIEESNLPWLKVDIEIPFKKILEEAKFLKHKFVEHRSNDTVNGYKHKGWKSLCIHGISAEKTNHFAQYGYKSNEETPYDWTEVVEFCPITKLFFEKYFPFDKYYRVRFMLLEPGGYIAPHKDSEVNKLSPINIALNHPKNCIMRMEGKGDVPFTDGSVFMLDVGNIHAYVNKSDEDRYHIIVHGKPGIKWKNLVEKSFEKQYSLWST